jgi:hypothetical protein
MSRCEKIRARECPWGAFSPAIRVVQAFAAVLSVHRSIRGVMGLDVVGRVSQASMEAASPNMMAAYSNKLLEM